MKTNIQNSIMKATYVFSFFCLISLLLSCNKIDFTNPEEVVKKRVELIYENSKEAKIELYDNFLSVKSKEIITKDEFVASIQIPDSVKVSLLNYKVSLIENKNIENYFKRYRIEENYLWEEKKQIDTMQNVYYTTLIKENKDWKVLSISKLFDLTVDYGQKGDFDKVKKIAEQMIGINPYNATGYIVLASYYRNANNNKSNINIDEEISKNLKIAMELEPENKQVYSMFIAYYQMKGKYDLALQYGLKGVEVSTNKFDKAVLYNEIASSCINLLDYTKARFYLNKSLKIDPNQTQVYFYLGSILFNESNYAESFKMLEKAIKMPPMASSSQGELYYLYAGCAYYNNKNDIAKEFIFKALNINPQEQRYQDLANSLSKL